MESSKELLKKFMQKNDYDDYMRVLNIVQKKVQDFKETKSNQIIEKLTLRDAQYYKDKLELLW